WDIVGNGHKLGYCLMDYYTCSGAPNHCKDDNTVYNQGNTLLNSNFPNWQLGGGNYGCAPSGQGISSGYEDVYSESLGGMWINIPPGTCNGNYWIVYEVDPHDYFLEENENNNFTAVPYTLTQQATPGNPVIDILPDRSANLCTGEQLKLTATAGTAYTWSTGATAQSVLVGPGTYTVTVTNYCGTGTASYVVAGFSTPIPVVTGDTVCVGTSATLSAAGANITWYDGGGNVVGTGNNFTTPILNSTATYFVTDETEYPGIINNVGKFDNTGTGGYTTSTTNYLEFDVFRPLKIKSVKVFANGAGNRTIILSDEIGIYLAAVIANVPNGESRVDLNFNVMPGKNYSLRMSGNVNLWRNTAGVSYPYTMVDTLSIVGSSSGSGNYYFFYDWEVEVGGAVCTSPQTAVTATVETCVGINDSWDLTNNFSVHPNPSAGNFTFDIIMPGLGDVVVKVLDFVGRKIHVKKIKNLSGKYAYDIDMSASVKGMYMMDVLIGNKHYFRKLVVQ
ncbi:MAG TPA: T9SS type A sorting domain-containing protein, partial [Bacteroidia bacterium]|nr:T9SS type A sorting domain-containing protein [Bacteroidia bacterium]